MKTEFLKSLGITDKNVISQIMAENGKDVNAARRADFTEERQRLAEEYANQLQEVRKEYEIKAALNKAGARDVVSVLAHLNTDVIHMDSNGKLSGLDEQINILTKSENTSFLFQKQDSQQETPVGTVPGQSYDYRLNWNAPKNRELGKSNLSEAIRQSLNK